MSRREYDRRWFERVGGKGREWGRVELGFLGFLGPLGLYPA
jgi:hypothetical protein